MTTQPTLELTPPVSIERPRVAYVMGSGRSGSTILGVALGNCAGIFYAGELDAWLRTSGVPPQGGAERARFWETVADEVGSEEFFGESSWRRLEHSLSPFRIWAWPARRRLRQRYRSVAERLYRATARAAGTPYIIDTSHYPLRARELQLLEGIDLHLIYLVRDPHDVVASFRRRDVGGPSRAPLVTNAYLWLTHLLSVAIFLLHPRDRRVLVRYEDFIAEPGRMLSQILGWWGIASELPELTHLRPGVPFQGNRLVQQETLSVVHPTTARVALRITSLIQAPWKLLLSSLGPTTGPALSAGDPRSTRSRRRRPFR
jgi:hypothetical protein